MFIVVDLSFELPAVARVISRHRSELRARESSWSNPGSYVVRVETYADYPEGAEVLLSSIRALSWLVNT